jgi:hypothetical protein
MAAEDDDAAWKLILCFRDPRHGVAAPGYSKKRIREILNLRFRRGVQRAPVQRRANPKT